MFLGVSDAHHPLWPVSGNVYKANEKKKKNSKKRFHIGGIGAGQKININAPWAGQAGKTQH